MEYSPYKNWVKSYPHFSLVPYESMQNHGNVNSHENRSIIFLCKSSAVIVHRCTDGNHGWQATCIKENGVCWDVRRNTWKQVIQALDGFDRDVVQAPFAPAESRVGHLYMARVFQGSRVTELQTLCEHR